MSADDPAEPDASARPRLRLGVGAAVTLGLVVLSAAVGWGILKGQAAPVESIALDGGSGHSAERDDTAVAPDEGIYVHVLGEVTTPGLYIVDPDARLVDALAAAGGTLDTADLQAVNLARPLSDGEQLVVPRIGAEPATGGAVAIDAGGPDADGVVNLNTADVTALETLPRIGPALAQRIIDWRDENGRFRSVDDLLAVPGIGEKLLAGVREKVRV
ncbi:ComEA family DNA-binding protein [Microbacterium esteraromaticum]|uniref:ComEA family DNA-binding protein n=1 Tax=Microbacterium esteraromaticum TaxID=57043 RepID=A0A7D8AIE5_9MICO|nr:ComEA family DNA-binding protein [Microbacterium esteraromaticum]QMU98363.1 ComEA family DNA-binding protein [Microbacterium esteraromaticum]